MLVYGVDLKLIEDFIDEHVVRKCLDDRTEKAYRLDLEHFYDWVEQKQNLDSFRTEEISGNVDNNKVVETREMTETIASAGMDCLEDWMEIYLDYLVMVKNLSYATVCRKRRVFSYYLSYLSDQGIISCHRTLRPAMKTEDVLKDRNLLSKKELDAFFAAMSREYEELDSEFRKRICLRDMVMMELLFYHKIEISEILRLETRDYDQTTGYMTIRRKRGEESCIYLFSQELRRKMEKWLVEREEFLCEGEYFGRVFISKFGRPLSMKMIIKIFRKYREMAGIKREFTPKDLKESCMKQYARDLVMERCG